MKNIVNTYLDRFRHERRMRIQFILILLALAVMVIGLVFWRLHYIGVALTDAPNCGITEHVHTEDCYVSALICGLEESAPSEGHTHTDACYDTMMEIVCGKETGEGAHTHTDACFDENGDLICGLEESEGHIHTADCYESTEVLVCQSEECAPTEGHTHTADCYKKTLVCGLEEHTHTLACMSDEKADTETKEDWEATLPDELTGIWREDVVTIARSQIGYHESTQNFILDEDGDRKGYTRYGAWYGNAYGDWCAMFASWCIHYAGIDSETFPYQAGCYAWTVQLGDMDLYHDTDYLPQPGDLIFFDNTGDGRANHVGIVEKYELNGEEIDYETVTAAPEDGEITVSDLTLYTIEGNSGNQVKENHYALTNDQILGYGELPEQEDMPEAEEETPEEDAEAVGEDDLEEETPEEVAVEGETVDEEAAETEIVPLSDVTGEVLNGDYAYLTSVGMEVSTDSRGNTTEMMTTGTAPWDTTEGAGNDTSETDRILRTYDVATYTVTMTTKTRNGAPADVYETGDLYLELVVKGSAAEVQWETGSMGWLESKHGVYTVTTEQYNGEDYQVLRGHITLEPSQEYGHAIGETVQTLAIDLRALAMQNEDVLQPQFTFFLAYNDVGLTSDQYNAWGTSSYSGPIVTFEGKACTEHEAEDENTEYHTVTAPEITISAAPRYNLAIVNSTESKTQQMGSYDFSTGNELAPDKNAGEYYGRLGSYGLVLQIVGKDASNGLRGVELPAEGGTLSVSFTLDLSSTYTAGGTTYTTGTTSGGQDLTAYAPLVWSFDVNKSGSTQQDNRSIPTSTKYADKVPYNKLNQTSDAYWYDSCADGGSWSIEVNSDGTYTVTITGCTVDTDQFPYVHPGAGTSLSYNYYNPNEINYSPNDSTKNSYWEMQTACISAGEMWVVQPYYAGEKDDGETYIAQMLGEGTYSVTLTDTALSVKQGDKELMGDAGQALTTDDSVGQSMALVNPGTIDQHIAYVKYNYSAYNDPLTDGCFSSAKDWILKGDQLTIETYVTNDSAEEGNTGVAYDVMIKFDDAFFQPDGTIKHSDLLNSETRTDLWAAKPNGTGWDHEGLSPDEEGYDYEMINATPDNLVYFSSLNDLENAGYTCVGVLVQYRGLMTEQQNHLHTYVLGSSKMSAESDQVYMVTPYCRTWDRDDLAAAMAADPENEYYGNSSAALSALLGMETSEVKTVVNRYIPTRTAGDTYQYEDESGNAKDYPSAHWINGDTRHPTTATGGSSRTPTILNYVKCSYDESGCHEGTSGNYWGDSCLLVGYTSGLTLKVAQQTTTGDGTTQDKYVFDLDTNQTVVDYEVIPFITRNNGEGSSETSATTEVVVTVTLPKKLTYIKGSSCIGGTYETVGEGVQGTVTGGTQLTEGEKTTFTYTVTYTVEKEDGTTVEVSESYTVGVLLTVTTDENGCQVLTYTFTNIPVTGMQDIQYLDEIYFSCEISSGAVTNGEQLEIAAEICCDSDKGVEPALRENGQATRSIAITKDSAISLVKSADQTIVEVNEDIGYTIDIGDNSPNELTMIAVDALPYNGDGYSTFANEDCEVYVTEFSAYDVTAERDLSSYFFFYTTNKKFKDVTSADYPNGEYFVTDFGTEDAAVNEQCEKDGWVAMKMEESGKDGEVKVFSCTNLPTAKEQKEKGQVCAIVGIGVVEGHDDINMHVTVKLSNPEPGDTVVNRITQQHAIAATESATSSSAGAGGVVTYDESTGLNYEDLNDSARVRVIGRTVSGTVWLDEDLDGGIRTGVYDNEQLLGGVDVKLQTKDSSGNWVTAQKLKTSDNESAACETKTNENGYYKFDYLPEGEFRVVFSGSGAGDGSGESYALAEHKVTVYGVSKVERAEVEPLDSSGSTDYINDITLPAKSYFYTISNNESTYSDTDENGGYTENVPFTVEKIWLDLDGNNITGQRTTGNITVQVATNENVVRQVLLNTENSWTSTIENLPYYDGNGKAYDYKVTDFTVTETEGGEGYNSSIGDIKENDDGGYSVTVTNQGPKELPKTGGIGTIWYTTAGLLLITGAAYLLYRTKRKERRKESGQ